MCGHLEGCLGKGVKFFIFRSETNCDVSFQVEVEIQVSMLASRVSFGRLRVVTLDIKCS